MKFLHTADLHIGKKIFELSMIEDQRHILNQIYHIACQEQVDAVIIAGDVYDRAVPSTEAVSLLDGFLTRLIQSKIPVLMISGNHDSPERVSFAGRILEQQGLHIAGEYMEDLKQVTLYDALGPVTFVLLPFVKPGVCGCSNSAEAVKKLLEGIGDLPEDRRRVLLTHYFVTGEQGEVPLLSDSETDVNVGGLDNVPSSLFRDYDYVALGHIHRPQQIGGQQVYYSGAPLKYSFSEARGEKSVRVVELGEKGQVRSEKHPLTPLHEMRCIRGRLADLTDGQLLENQDAPREDYLQVTLTDTEELIDPISTLRSVYPNVLQILLEKNLGQEQGEYEVRLQTVRKSTEELFSEFYEMLKGEEPDDKRRQIIQEAAKAAERTEL